MSPEEEGRPGYHPEASQKHTSSQPEEYPADLEYEKRLRAWCEGWECRQEEIDALLAMIARLNSENDRLYLLAHNTPAQVREIYQLRLDRHFEAEAVKWTGVAA